MARTITHYKGNRSPSKTDVIRIDGVAFPLTTSTVKLKVRAEGSATLLINEAAVVTDAPNGAIRYDPSVAFAALVVGEYPAWWEVTLPSGLTQDTPEFNLSILDHAQVTRTLCEIEDVTAYAPGYRDDPNTTSVIEQLVLAESRAIHQETGREFKAIVPANDPRQFDIWDWNANCRIVNIGDASTITTVTVKDAAGTVLQTVATTDRVSLPRVREEWEPITALYFPFDSASPASFIGGTRVLEVTGTWGFPVVPADLREACARLVLFRYVTDVTAAGSSFAEALAEVNVGALFANARSVVERYQLPLVA
jgi:hypothetical protein